MVARSAGQRVRNGVARLTNYSQFAWWMIRSSARYWGRRARRRCVVCGGARVYSSDVWRGPLRHACGWCNKRAQHGMNYGMGPLQFQKADVGRLSFRESNMKVR